MWSNYPEIVDELAMVERYLRTNIKSRNALLTEAVLALIEAGGKRLRPAFLLICAKFGRSNLEKVIPTACAIEVLHLATLVHDDLIDNAKLRRGIPTVHEKYQIDMAVYTGDFLYTKAVMLFSKNISKKRLDLVARSIKATCEGEVDQYKKKWNSDISVLFYLKYIARKTAFLFAQSCSLGAYHAKCSKETSKLLARFGLNYGMAFQIRDDIHDIVSTSDLIGKSVKNDIANGLLTLPAILAMNRNREVQQQLSHFIAHPDNITPEKVQSVLALIVHHEGVEEAIAILSKYIARGLEALAPLPDTPYKNLLADSISALKIR